MSDEGTDNDKKPRHARDENTLSTFQRVLEDSIDSWKGVVIESVTSPGQMLARWWFESFKRHPAITGVSTVLLFAGVLTIGFVTESSRKKRVEQDRAENLTLHNQLKQLDNTESSIKELLEFVREQKTRVKDSETTIERLKEEKAQLEPLVNADKETVDSFFSVHEQRQQRGVWTERWIGFGFGVAASILATAICTIVAAFVKRKRKLAGSAEQVVPPNGP